MSIRWLHLSDFHTGKDNYGQRKLFRYLLDDVQKKYDAGIVPDFIFITGDLANQGKANEYELFFEEFVLPLADIVNDLNLRNIFVIPGNHDVDRSKSPLVDSYTVPARFPYFFDPTHEGLQLRADLLDRFKGFRESDLTELSGEWLFSQQGVYAFHREINNCKVGILGINTAWLSYSDQDRHRLAVGKQMVEDGLKIIQDADVRIVLGHHPIDWFHDDELYAVRSLFGKYGVLYLHGHLHKSFSRFEEAAGYPFLAIQSGACFQARENETWVNRFLWTELDLEQHRLIFTPSTWSKDHQEWVLDGGAFPEKFRAGDRWILPLPGNQLKIVPVTAPQEDTFEVPSVWTRIQASFLNQRRVEMTPEQVVEYFNGSMPSWREALSPHIPRREIVEALVNKLEEITEKPQVVLLTGAGGEGKSTIMRQVVCDLLELNPDWLVLWRDNPDVKIDGKLLDQLHRVNKTSLIVSDDAARFVKHIFDTLERNPRFRRGDLKFLLASRETDLINEGTNDLDWRRIVQFTHLPINGISEIDALSIVAAWRNYGIKGLGRLVDLSSDKERATRLVEASKLENYREEGAFLGALLRERHEDNLKQIVARFMKQFIVVPITKNHTLLDAYAYIVIPHAYGLLSLSKVLLARALDLEVKDIKRIVIKPLGKEVLDRQSILARHRTIAEVAVQLLPETFSIDVTEYLAHLVSCAASLRGEGVLLPDLSGWQFFSTKLFDRGEIYHNAAIRIAQAGYDGNRRDPYMAVNLAKLYRTTEQPENSITVFRDSPADSAWHRAFFAEWAQSEHEVGNPLISIWLAAVSLSNEVERGPIDRERLSISFRILEDAFIKAVQNYPTASFKESLEVIRRMNREKYYTMTHKDFGRWQLTIREAHDQKEDTLPEWVPSELSFTLLSQRLNLY